LRLGLVVIAFLLAASVFALVGAGRSVPGIGLSRVTEADGRRGDRSVARDSGLGTKEEPGSPSALLPTSLDQLLALSKRDLVQVDLALMNLLCAKDLRGAESLSIAECSAVLDKWAASVKSETDRHMYRFRQNPQEYENSEGFFRMLMLNTVLQQDFGVHYNLERMRDVNFSNSKDLFIHGMINDQNGGTCVSMPVLVTAVARRLGYPVRLITTKAHVFCRWDAPGDRINLEPSGVGLNTFPDEYYKSWPMPSSETEIAANRFLVSMTPKEELAMFLENRGHCLMENKKLAEAETAFAQAGALCPGMGRFRCFLAEARRARELASGNSGFGVGPSQGGEGVGGGIWDVMEHNRRMRRYSTQNPIADPNPYVNRPAPVGQGGVPRGFGSQVGAPLQPRPGVAWPQAGATPSPVEILNERNRRLANP
jgi:hypothetical protein